MYTQSTFLSLLLRFARKSNSHVHTDEAKTHMYTQMISHSHANLTHMYTQTSSHVHTNDLVLSHHYKIIHGETNLLLQSLAALLMGRMVGLHGLGQKQTKRQQTADTSNIDHRRGGMGWDGMGWDKNKPNDSKQQTLATSTIGGVVGWDGLGLWKTKRQQAADTSNIDHRRGGGMGWAGTITHQTTANSRH